jgi:hypothetical protein
MTEKVVYGQTLFSLLAPIFLRDCFPEKYCILRSKIQYFPYSISNQAEHKIDVRCVVMIAIKNP